jgi:hypothetical protein
MVKKLEDKWVAFTNSDNFRQITRRESLSRIFNSKVYKSANLSRRYAVSYYKSKRFPKLLNDVEKFCVFVGQTKSGCSMVGGLLDAHPNIIISDEVNILHYVEKGFNQNQLFHLILHASRREHMKGRVTARRLAPYSFLVPDQWQGSYTKLNVIGDSTAGKSTQILAANPHLIQDLRGIMVGKQIRIIQVIRNPFDPITIMMIRGKRSFENALQHYFEDCDTLKKFRSNLNSEDLCAIRYEDFVYSPAAQLVNLCKFLGTEASEDYLDSCTRILKNTPERSRDLAEWNLEWIKQVEEKIDQYDFLEGYSFRN